MTRAGVAAEVVLCQLRTAPLDGYPVVAGVSDNLRITHQGVSSDIAYDVVILGIG